MSNTLYYIICAVLIVGVLLGISLLSKVKTARIGNTVSACSMALAIFVTLLKYQLLSLGGLWICIAIGLVLGLIGAAKVKMIQMPQAVAMLNGFGGAASALVAVVFVLNGSDGSVFSYATAGLALAVGTITFSGSAIAAAKLHKLINQRPVIWVGHQSIVAVTLILLAVTVLLIPAVTALRGIMLLFCGLLALFFGIAFAIRVGGADMPITISLLNSLSGVAGAIAGMAISDPLLVAIGGVVGASGIILTQIMCRGMNRNLADILMGKTTVVHKKEAAASAEAAPVVEKTADTEANLTAISEDDRRSDIFAQLKKAKTVIIIPGYGMALAQAQFLVKQLVDKLESGGTEVKFAIHPVAGRMPGHMNVLLCEVDIPYEQLFEMDDINPQFADCDIALVIGANDVINPAANTAEGTPIYGMPVLQVGAAPRILICNFDLKPGYAGVDNPLYTEGKAVLMQGDAKDSLQTIIDNI